MKIKIETHSFINPSFENLKLAMSRVCFENFTRTDTTEISAEQINTVWRPIICGKKYWVFSRYREV
jgi:hypothetical protein